MTHQNSPQAHDLPPHFIEVPFPPIHRSRPGEFSLASVIEQRTQRRGAERYWRMLHRWLVVNGIETSLCGVEQDRNGGWRIHFKSSYPDIVGALHGIAIADGGPGELRGFYAYDRLNQWLGHVEHRIADALEGGVREPSNI